MKAFQLRPYQANAIKAIQEALIRKQQHIVIEMAAGCGKGIILARTLQLLSEQSQEKILIATGSLLLKEHLEHDIFTVFDEFVKFDKDNLVIQTAQRILKHPHASFGDFSVVIFYDIAIPKALHDALSCNKKTVIAFFTANQELSHHPFTSNDIVFSYDYKDAVDDGYLTPAMDTRAFAPTVVSFTKQLLKQLGCEHFDEDQKDEWDLIAQKATQRIWVECKTYKSQVVSPSTASSLLNDIVMRKLKQKIPKSDLILLMVFSQIPSFQKEEIYKRYNIVVLDIENLVFYANGNSSLLKQLSQITYFPIDYIESYSSKEADQAGLLLKFRKEETPIEIETETSETSNLIQRLKECKAGKNIPVTTKMFVKKYYVRSLRQPTLIG